MTQICIFEDNQYQELFPLTLTRPAYALRFGLKDLLSKIISALPIKNNIVLHCRRELQAILAEKTFWPLNNLKKEETIFVNGRILPDQNFIEAYKFVTRAKEGVVLQGQIPLIAKVPKSKLDQIKLPDIIKNSFFKDIKILYLPNNSKLNLMTYFWDFVNLNSQEILNDAKRAKILGKHLSKTKLSSLVKPKNIYIGKDVLAKPGVVLDASDGPIIIDNNVVIEPNTVISGPVYIGEKVLIKAGAKLYHGTSIGPMCKIGGEIEGTIFQGYSNKQHEGFLGHSFVGEWVNLGAGTENSDLKNNYSSVSVKLATGEVDTHSQFVGCCIGDHTKTGIKTMINTGSVFGIFCNLFGPGYQPKYIPSFRWNDNIKKMALHDFAKAIETAKAVVKRRHCNLSPAQEDLYKSIFQRSRTGK